MSFGKLQEKGVGKEEKFVISRPREAFGDSRQEQVNEFNINDLHTNSERMLILYTNMVR